MDVTFFAILAVALLAVYTSIRFERFRSRVDEALEADLDSITSHNLRLNRLQDRINGLSITPPEVVMNIASGAITPEKLAPAPEPTPAPQAKIRPGARAFTQAGVRDMRARRKGGQSVAEIAEHYNCALSTVYRALKGPITDWPVR